MKPIAELSKEEQLARVESVFEGLNDLLNTPELGDAVRGLFVNLMMKELEKQRPQLEAQWQAIHDDGVEFSASLVEKMAANGNVHLHDATIKILCDSIRSLKGAK